MNRKTNKLNFELLIIKTISTMLFHYKVQVCSCVPPQMNMLKDKHLFLTEVKSDLTSPI